MSRLSVCCNFCQREIDLRKEVMFVDETTREIRECVNCFLSNLEAEFDSRLQGTGLILHYDVEHCPIYDEDIPF